MIGRLLRDQMRDDATANSPERVAERVARRAAGERAHAEMLARFSPLTAENIAEAIAWQEARMRELTA